jgi:diphthamide synthase (EF-2-diphthine--ammonia ligase)
MVRELHLEQAQGLKALIQADRFAEDSYSTMHEGRERALRQAVEVSTLAGQVPGAGADKDLEELMVSCSANSPFVEAVVAGDIDSEHNQEQTGMMGKVVEV